MSNFKNKTIFSYNDLFSVKTPDNSAGNNCPGTCVPSTCNDNTLSGCEPCYKKEYCTNKKFANNLYTNNAKYLGKSQEHSDISQVYNNEYIKSVNLIAGIIGILSFIFYNK